jgi:hypothetical protein
MKPGVHDLGWLKRVDRGDGQSDLIDPFGDSVATVETATLEPYSQNLGVVRYRLTVQPSTNPSVGFHVD